MVRWTYPHRQRHAPRGHHPYHATVARRGRIHRSSRRRAPQAQIDGCRRRQWCFTRPASTKWRCGVTGLKFEAVKTSIDKPLFGMQSSPYTDRSVGKKRRWSKAVAALSIRIFKLPRRHSYLIAVHQSARVFATHQGTAGSDSATRILLSANCGTASHLMAECGPLSGKITTVTLAAAADNQRSLIDSRVVGSSGAGG